MYDYYTLILGEIKLFDTRALAIAPKNLTIFVKMELYEKYEKYIARQYTIKINNKSLLDYLK